jgi:hypothetical protein
MKTIILTMMLTVSTLASAGVSCDKSGDAPSKFNPSLAPKIVKWVTGVERQLKLQPPLSKVDAIRLQAVISEWEGQAPAGSVDSFFRSAVAHGVNVQYETFMQQDDPENSKKHRFFIDLEAARADACLSLTRY